MATPVRPHMTEKRPVIVITIALMFAFALILAVYFLARAPQALKRVAIEKKEQRVDIAALVTQMREISRLETASMRVMHISTIQQSYGVIPNDLLGDKLTFLAVGDVVAGVDLSLIQEQDIRYTGNGGVAIDLPPPMILVVKVDNQESRVIDRDTGVLRRADVHLESRIRRGAEAAIRNEATRKGILVMAEQSAEKKIADFLKKLGFQQVSFEHREAGRVSG